MKSKVFHIASSVFLIGTLLFVQIGVNFFHRNHDVHTNKSITIPLQGDHAAVQKHGEHCKVCSVDFFNHAFLSSTQSFVDRLDFVANNIPISFSIKRVAIPYSQGRAPPVSFI